MDDKEKRNARQARYRQKESLARLDLVVSPELKERFRALPGLEGKTNAEKLEALCNAWEAKTDPDPKASSKALSLALKRIDSFCELWAEAREQDEEDLEVHDAASDLSTSFDELHDVLSKIPPRKSET